MEEKRPTQHFVKGQPIVTEGAPGDRTYRLVSGEALVCKRNSHGEMLPIATLAAGDMFGEMYLFEPDRARSATVIAVSSEVVVEVYFHEEMQKMLKSLNPAAYDMLEGFNSRLRKTSERCVEAKTPTTPTPKPGISILPDGTLKSTGNIIRS
jgi:CRP-like cAMP-binding protein